MEKQRSSYHSKVIKKVKAGSLWQTYRCKRTYEQLPTRTDSVTSTGDEKFTV